MRLAKQSMDVGLYSNRRDEQLAFWRDLVGLEYDHLGKLGGGVQQHRHHMNGSILKMNHARDPLPDTAPSGIIGLQIARDGVLDPRPLVDPDGDRVTLVPPGHDGVTGIAIELRVGDPDQHDRFWTEVMQLERLAFGRYRCGTTLIVLAEQGPVAPPTEAIGPGYRYTTVQVHDCVAEYEGILARGGQSAGAPRVLGDTVRFAFVADPDGNRIEISERASLTGRALTDPAG
ncbi:VOC family protein [Cumulibacter manganitolerans]|uniref:VOC family protein n=1 Tax=Cumulibacter manganitolerans TaxID=1884992 RepID=UPI0012967082|nr:VOC family protein [Cumulibacter manganitolerans]